MITVIHPGQLFISGYYRPAIHAAEMSFIFFALSTWLGIGFVFTPSFVYFFISVGIRVILMIFLRSIGVHGVLNKKKPAAGKSHGWLQYSILISEDNSFGLLQVNSQNPAKS